MKIINEINEVATSDLVIEAIVEDMHEKSKVFRLLDGIMKRGAILATNTSYLDLNQIADVTERPEYVLGLHFFSPAHIMPLLEIVNGKYTSEQTLAFGFYLAKKMKMIGVKSVACEGFIGNRILEKTRQAALTLIADGAMPWSIDKAMESFGMRMGPFRVMDMAGLDIAWARRKEKMKDHVRGQRYVAIADRICERGWLGRKVGRGWYKYDQHYSNGSPDPEIERMIIDYSRENDIERRNFSNADIQKINHIMDKIKFNKIESRVG